MTIKRNYKGKKWICFRPEYLYSSLEYDFLKEGFERIFLLFGIEKRISTFRDKKGIIWLSYFPSNYFADLFWDKKCFFDKFISQRYKFIARIKEYIQEVKRGIKNYHYKKGLDLLDKYKTIHHDGFGYILAVSLSDEELVRRFCQFLQEKIKDNELVFNYLFSLLTSEYSQKAAQERKIVPQNKNLVFPAPSPVLVEARIKKQIKTKYRKLIWKRLKNGDQRLFGYYERVVFILSQLGDENLYVWNGLKMFINKVIEVMAHQLIANKIFKKPQDILGCDLLALKKYKKYVAKNY